MEPCHVILVFLGTVLFVIITAKISYLVHDFCYIQLHILLQSHQIIFFVNSVKAHFCLKALVNIVMVKQFLPHTSLRTL